MSLSLPQDVNISPASLRPDLWLWEVSAESWAKQWGRDRDTLPAGELKPYRRSEISGNIFLFPAPYPQTGVACSFTITNGGSCSAGSLDVIFQTKVLAMETEQSPGSCPAPGQTAVRTWLPSSTRGTVQHNLLDAAIWSNWHFLLLIK